MAGELEISMSAIYDDGLGTVIGPVEFAELLITLATNRGLGTVQSIGTSAEAIELGDLSADTIGTCIFVNLDTTNYIQIKRATGETLYFAKLFPKGSTAGISFCVYDGSQAPFAIANSAACKMLIFVLPL